MRPSSFLVVMELFIVSLGISPGVEYTESELVNNFFAPSKLVTFLFLGKVLGSKARRDGQILLQGSKRMFVLLDKIK